VRAGFERERITVMHPFAEPLIGKHPNEKKKQRKHEQKYILFAGRLEAYKGAHVLLHALDHLPSDISVVLAGVGPDEARLRAMTRNDSRVTFLGFVPGEKLWNLMEDAVVVVVPSLWHEPYGLVALEAMCRGTPVIVTQQGGLPEILGDDACGMVVPSGDSSALGRAVTRLWNNDVLARTMGDAAFVRARQIADPEVHSGHVMKVYETAIEKCAQSR
jgi:glycosyltransferase involved in cell wall biosynthesis